MSRFGRSGSREVRETYSLLVLNVSFRMTSDDLFLLFDRYGEVVDIHIPRDRRTGHSRGFAFVRYNYQDEAQLAVDKLDGRMLDGRAIIVQFAKYGPNAERIERGRIVEKIPKPGDCSRSRSPKRSERGRIVEKIPKPGDRPRSRSPRRRYRDDHQDRDYRSQSRSRSREKHGDRHMDRGYRSRSRSHSISPDYDRKHTRYRPSSVRRGPSYSRSPSPRRATREVTPSRLRVDSLPRS